MATRSAFRLSGSWTRYRIGWSDLQQTGWGAPAAFDAGAIMSVEFAFGTGVSFELYVDELRFY